MCHAQIEIHHKNLLQPKKTGKKIRLFVINTLTKERLCHVISVDTKQKMFMAHNFVNDETYKLFIKKQKNIK